MIKSLTLVATVIVSLATTAFAVNESAIDVTSVDRSLGNFYGLIVNANANVILIQGEKSSVRIEGKRKDVDKIEARINNGSLVINGTNNIPVTVYVTVDEINRVEVNSTAKVYSSEVINSDVLLLKVNGNGSIKLDVRALSLGMFVKGKGKILISGSAGDSYARIIGDGRIYSSNLDSYSSRTEISKANTAYIKESDKSGRRLTLRLTN